MFFFICYNDKIKKKVVNKNMRIVKNDLDNVVTSEKK